MNRLSSELLIEANLSACESSPLSSLPTTPVPSRQFVEDLSQILPSIRKTPRSAPRRAPSLPPLSSDGLIPTSPLTGSRGQKQMAARRKGTRKKRLKQAEIKVSKEAETAAALQRTCNDALELLHSEGFIFADLCDHFFSTNSSTPAVRWDDFFVRRSCASHMMDFWASADSPPSARREVHAWSIRFVEGKVQKEAQTITKNTFLRETVTPENLEHFSFTHLGERLRQDWAPTAMRILEAFSTSRRQLTEGLSKARAKRKSLVQTVSAFSLLSEYSRLNMFTKRVMGLYLYTTGAQRQTMAVLSRFGICESYPSLVRKGTHFEPRIANVSNQPVLEPQPGGRVAAELPFCETDDEDSDYSPNSSDCDSESEFDCEEGGEKKTQRRTAGTISNLSFLLQRRTCVTVGLGLAGGMYDNINFMAHNAEQVVGRKDTQENGTNYTFFQLFKASTENMLLHDYNKAFLCAPQLRIQDIMHTPAEADFFRKSLIHCVLRIIVTHGGAAFEKFRKELEKSLPVSDLKIEVHRTELFPCSTMPIDESTIVGNADVDETIVEVTKMRETSWWMKIVRILGADQLSLARLCAVFNLRAGKEGGYAGFGWGVWFTGLFHAKMADIHGVLTTHWGKANSHRNPASLWFHNSILYRLPIVPTSLPPFRTCRDLVFVSLYARVLHCLLLVSEAKSLEKYAAETTWDGLIHHAELICDRYMNTEDVQDLQAARKQEELKHASTQPKKTEKSRGKGKKQEAVVTESSGSAQPLARTEGDMVYEGGVLFLRDAAISREFTDAVKAGDSGRVLLVLKIWALSYRGSGRSKYAYEMLHLIHNIAHVWPKPLRDIVLNNWLLNLKGKPDCFLEVDLVQEHLNYWIKTVYKAHGSNSSWEWLSMIAPCTDVFRKLARNVNESCGEAGQGSRHAPPDLSKDITTLMDSLVEHKVYSINKGRAFDADDPPTKDIITEGLCALASPLRDYNAAFKKLQRRRRQMPVVGGLDPGLDISVDAGAHEQLDQPVPQEAEVAAENLEADLAGVEDDDHFAGDVFQGEIAEVFDAEDEQTFTLDNEEDVALDMDVVELVV